MPGRWSSFLSIMPSLHVCGPFPSTSDTETNLDAAEAATNTQLFECITSWLREVPVAAIAASPLLNVVVNGLSHEQSLAAAADCLGAMCRETSDVDDNIETIKILLPRVVEQRSRLQAAAEDEDDKEAFKALARLFADAGDSWVVLIAREPQHCRPLVDALLECAARDKGRDAIEYTFNFWYELKQLIVLDRYAQAKAQLVDVYSKLVDILMKLLEYPQSETANELDLFDGDREEEEKFREFRHHMGDTLKDCCQVMGTAACLSKVLEAIQIWVQKYGSQTTPTSVPHWQELEAPLFSMRAMGRMVDKEESVILPQLMPLLVQIPSHEKLRFAAIMVIGRYTEWTAVHSEFLEAQFNYIVSSFDAESKEIVRAAAQAIKFFCTDCRHLLGPQVLQLQAFYNQILDKLPELSQEEITEGVANVVGVQKSEDIYHLLKLYCDPLVERLKAKANNATTEEGKLAVADHLQLLKIFAQYVVPYIHDGQENPAVKYWLEVFPVMSAILDNFIDFVPICERVCRCWRTMLISYRTSMTPLLGPMASKLADGFAKSRQGCFLWVTGAVLREFSEEREHVNDSITDNIYVFFETQATTVLRIMNELPPQDLPDVIEDFFRLLIDALLYYPHKLIPSDLFSPIFEAAVAALALEQRDPLSATLHYIRDLINYGGDNWAGASNASLGPAGDHIRQIVRQLLVTQGEVLVKRIMAGMMITFPRDCFADGSGVLLGMFEILPQQTIVWVERTLRMLPEGTVTPVETNRLMSKIREKLDPSDAGGLRQVRALLQDFTNTYRRRYVAPREGLGGLEPTKFHYNG
jgi:transportin-3